MDNGSQCAIHVRISKSMVGQVPEAVFIIEQVKVKPQDQRVLYYSRGICSARYRNEL